MYTMHIRLDTMQYVSHCTQRSLDQSVLHYYDITAVLHCIILHSIVICFTQDTLPAAHVTVKSPRPCLTLAPQCIDVGNPHSQPSLVLGRWQSLAIYVVFRLQFYENSSLDSTTKIGT